MNFFYYNTETKENLKFKAKDRSEALEKLEKKYPEKNWLEIGAKLRSDLQMACLQGFNLK